MIIKKIDTLKQMEHILHEQNKCEQMKTNGTHIAWAKQMFTCVALWHTGCKACSI